ncbi:MAG: hypothetical protein RR687_05410, partial [Comamonas sp.]
HRAEPGVDIGYGAADRAASVGPMEQAVLADLRALLYFYGTAAATTTLVASTQALAFPVHPTFKDCL